MDINKLSSDEVRNAFDPPGRNLSALEKTERAQKNWLKLKDHITSMRDKPNYLVKFLDEENEIKQESMYNVDHQ